MGTKPRNTITAADLTQMAADAHANCTEAQCEPERYAARFCALMAGQLGARFNSNELSRLFMLAAAGVENEH